MSDQIRMAEKVRDACLQAALKAYEDAGISGLCAEGRWEIAVQAIRTLDVQGLLTGADTATER
ncbi:MAG: acetyltransferase [Chromatiaceae bacterium]|nr:acetyltransferase [Chromatiaceae bacterium]MCP5439362.1 acetyltransferase [Chromatiaceae bacterium]